MPESLMRRVAASIRRRFSTSAPERDMDEEMRFHLEMATRRNIERGITPDEARRRALATFGGVAQHQEAARENVPGHWLDELRQDLRYAGRTLRRNPGFTASVVLTLALGVGANTAIFSVVNGVLLRPLPVRDPEELTYIGWTFGKAQDWAGSLSTLKFDFLRRHATSLAGLTTYRTAEHDLGTGPNAQPVNGLRVSDDFFSVIGTSPLVGRGFVPEEQKPGGPNAIVLSDALWRSAFGANRTVVGTQVRLSDTTYTVVGVTGPGFRVPGVPPEQTEFIVP